MNRPLSLGLAMLAGIALGATAIKGIHAQTKPPTYIVIDIAELTNPDGFKPATNSKAIDPVTASFGGRTVIRTQTVTALDGVPPQRFVVIAFDSKEQALAWTASPKIKEITAIRQRTSKSSSFIVAA